VKVKIHQVRSYRGPYYRPWDEDDPADRFTRSLEEARDICRGVLIYHADGGVGEGEGNTRRGQGSKRMKNRESCKVIGDCHLIVMGDNLP